MMNEYDKNGYFVIKQFFENDEIQVLRDVLQDFHVSWKSKNTRIYAEKSINSSYLTGTDHLDGAQRLVLFEFIGSSKLMHVASSIMSKQPTFMNTQLFFNPVNAKQQNYWHRDPQYHLSIEEQEAALKGAEVIHFRIPLEAEPGIELVPGSHANWDSVEELNVRLEKNGHKNYEPLTTGKKVKLETGDLLVFSANMIHRGLYGMERFALDILFCDPEPSLVKFVSDDCLPNQNILNQLENADAFVSTIELKAKR
ncbi:MAG: ectoine hydroxylase-related dioxygenase (phytanoyl-CoA dioxygenase family) [Oleiphilaceae bacterium]|jgi:ectoine hydroxylase-related dioxygenase (phytanoyl-CoA dioxygenase family)